MLSAGQPQRRTPLTRTRSNEGSTYTAGQLSRLELCISTCPAKVAGSICESQGGIVYISSSTRSARRYGYREVLGRNLQNLSSIAQGPKPPLLLDLARLR